MFKRFIVFILLPAFAAILFSHAAFASGTSLSKDGPSGPEVLIPLPEEVVYGSGTYILPEIAHFSVFTESGADAGEIEAFAGYVSASPLGAVSVRERASKADIRIIISGHTDGKTGCGAGDKSGCKTKAGYKTESEEGYVLEISSRGILITADAVTGAFYAVQSLLQMTRDGSRRELRCCTVSDSPRFGYRGVMVDVSRHFRSVAFLKKQMDAMALFKLNRMHLHLTDAAGWRIQIDSYPRLTEFAAWRPQRKWTDWTAGGNKYCGKDTPGAYGGYYTKEDIKDLLEYAAVRRIEIIPEIEMPGHSEDVTSSYPQIGCSGEPYRDADICPGNEEAFKFFETVLSEIIDLFPSEYIHIGGDEAGKSAWRTCSKCLERMEAEGLADVDELQSYFIRRIEKFVNSKGRKIIGWDEIMEGGLAPNAAVMSWRGSEQGIAAAKSGHDVIMTPGAYCYIDYNQDAPFKEPLSIGGYTPLSKVYSYEPMEPGVTDADMEHILGVQANLWSEYVTEDSHAEYMYYPRSLAIAEIGWSPKGQKNFDGFRTRALSALEQLQARGYNTFDLKNEYGERQASLKEEDHLAKGAKVTYSKSWHSQYPAAGESTLTDGIFGGWTYGDKRWQGFLSDADVTVDLGKVLSVRYIGATFMQSPGAWVYFPEQVRILVSIDGKEYVQAAVIDNEFPYRDPEIAFMPFAFVGDTEARFIRFEADVYDKSGSWLFIDEIVVR